jgi:hypothetical protein
MGDPRHTLVQLYVNGTAVEITDDLLEFTFTETIETKAHCLDVKLKDTDLKYRNRLFIKKGTKVTAEWRMVNWNGNGSNPPRGTGDLWIDTVEMELKPRTITFKATSIDPATEKGGKKHAGTEGKNANEISKESVTPSESTTQFIGNSAETPAEDPKQKRHDQENESPLETAERKAREAGKILVVQDGKFFMYRMADLEAQAPFTTISDGSSLLLSGRLKTTNQGKFKKGKIQYHDPKTGKLLTKEVEVELDDATNAETPAAVLNSRKRPNFSGPADDPDPDPEEPIGKNQSGDPGD